MQIDEKAEFARVSKWMADPASRFVFGSNEAGIHGAGAAKAALDKYGARLHQGFGPMGRSFAIPTKDWRIEPLNLMIIEVYVVRFLAYAFQYGLNQFVVTRIGCGLAGFEDEQIAPLFAAHPRNVHLPLGWDEYNRCR